MLRSTSKLAQAESALVPSSLVRTSDTLPVWVCAKRTRHSLYDLSAPDSRRRDAPTSDNQADSRFSAYGLLR
ncbi:hypothetical protein AcW1_007626 [Taiwanofungus camphoratus]|nr:hypothetical protein AcW2_007311 [Antrodia cinnamomea]KAI0927011.1 hypothetical protein AcV5_007656 [Antrodia cinnamomea]KAI0953395.1 hypothetical protein AcW1_007626 [Antrodia cinnamomea]